MNYLLHYLHLYKKEKEARAHEFYETHAVKSMGKKVLDDMIMVIAIFGPLANVSQIIKIFSARDAGGLSGFSWALYATFNVVWIIYGIVHKEKPILISSVLWLITQLIVLAGIIIY